MIYNTLVKTHLEYGILSWGNARDRILEKLINLQKKSVRIVSNKHRAHTYPIFASLNIFKFDDLLNMRIREFMFEHYNSKLTPSLQEIFVPLLGNNRTASYRIEIPNNDSLSRSPAVIFPKVWNNLNIDIKNMNHQKL